MQKELIYLVCKFNKKKKESVCNSSDSVGNTFTKNSFIYSNLFRAFSPFNEIAFRTNKIQIFIAEDVRQKTFIIMYKREILFFGW